MTRLRYLNTTCAICGEACRFTIPEAVASIGSRDLDTRPAEPLRSTIYAWVKRCPSCGYCAPDLGKAPEGAADVVKLPRYREQLDARRYPGVANTFLCWSLIQEDLGAPAQAAWASLHAAWVCDDEGNDVPARICRKRAADLLRRAWEQGERLASQAGADEALLVDLLRRAGRLRERRFLWTCSAGPGAPGGPRRGKGGAGAEPRAPHRRDHAAPGQVDHRIRPGRPHRCGGPAVRAASAAMTRGRGKAPHFVYCSADTVSWISRSSPPASTPTALC
ncbi:DUF2225 domain-containing protein [Methanoculleus bourgensis]|nr:DUF2225 domain-containing protein [Methanoculleus bourgensis]